MSHYKVLFLDIDGTIITPDDTIEESTKIAVSKVQEQGINVFLATGRPIHEIQDIATELKVNSFIGYNGAYAIYNGEDLYQEPMDSSLINDFLKVGKEFNHELVMYTNTHNAFTTLEKPAVERFIEKFHLKQNKLYDTSDVKKVLGVTVINVNGNEQLHYVHESGIHLTQINVAGMENCFDVIRDKFNKGYGVKCVLKHLGIGKESAIAFGDGLNDKEMLTNVSESFAMGNAHPDLFAYAKHKTTSVSDSGIFNGLKSLGIIN